VVADVEIYAVYGEMMMSDEFQEIAGEKFIIMISFNECFPFQFEAVSFLLLLLLVACCLPCTCLVNAKTSI